MSDLTDRLERAIDELEKAIDSASLQFAPGETQIVQINYQNAKALLAAAKGREQYKPLDLDAIVTEDIRLSDMACNAMKHIDFRDEQEIGRCTAAWVDGYKSASQQHPDWEKVEKEFHEHFGKIKNREGFQIMPIIFINWFKQKIQG